MNSPQTAPEWFTGGSSFSNNTPAEKGARRSRSRKDKKKSTNRASSRKNCSNSPSPKSPKNGVQTSMPQPRTHHDLHGVLGAESIPSNTSQYRIHLRNYGSVSTSSSNDDLVVSNSEDEEYSSPLNVPQDFTFRQHNQRRDSNAGDHYDTTHAATRINSRWYTKRSQKVHMKVRRIIEAAKDREIRIKHLANSQNEENEKTCLTYLPFAVLFYVQLFVVIFIAFYYGWHERLNNKDDTSTLSTIIPSDEKLSYYRHFHNSSTYPRISIPSFDSNLLMDKNNGQVEHFNTTWERSPFLNRDIIPSVTNDWNELLEMSYITGIYATSLSVMIVGIMMILSKSMIMSLLLLMDFLCFGWASVGMIVCPYSVVPVLGIIFLAVCTAYTIVVWDRIAFVSTNLDIALHGTRCTADIVITGFMSVVVSLVWNIIWTAALMGVHCHLSHLTGKYPYRRIEYYFVYDTALIISYFWTLNVIMNIVNVTVSGTIGKWWFEPEQVKPCCTKAFFNTLVSSLSTSFGSICFASLILPPVRLTRGIINYCCCHKTPSSQDDVEDIRTSNSSSSVLIISVQHSNRCISLDPFNSFALTMMGIYQYNFLTSGKKAAEIFRATDWTESIVSDRLVQNILSMASVIIGLMNGLFAVLVQEYGGYDNITSFLSPPKAAFLLGLFNGIVLSSVFLNILNSSMNAVLLCFAIGPHEFKQNHPRLSENMRSTWGGLWADDIV